MLKKYPERGRIDVIVRKRPLNEIEISRGDMDIVVCNNDFGIIREFKCKIDGTSFIEEHEFRVDRFYDEKADNELIYNEYVKPLVECAFRENMTCSCFTYGQTGSGKTYTMIGSRITNTKLVGSDPKIVAGIYEYAANDIYKILKESEYKGKIDVVISFFEIYSGKLYDLLQNRNPLESLDNGRNEVVIRDLSARTVKNKDELVELMLSGLNLRKIGQNSQNDRSSRSHALLRIELKNKNTSKLHGSLVFIDLAGSERAADSVGNHHTPDNLRGAKQSFERSSTGKSLFGEPLASKTSFEGTCINKSLLALKECIRAMESEKLHVPFRDSELTKVLRDIFLRESKNLMIANLSPSNRCFDQTLNTMRYASKVKSFKVNSASSSGSGITNENNNAGSSNNTNMGNVNPINKFSSLQSTKATTRCPGLYKNAHSCRFVKDYKLSTPTSSKSRNRPSNNDNMDLDPVVSSAVQSKQDMSNHTSDYATVNNSEDTDTNESDANYNSHKTNTVDDSDDTCMENQTPNTESSCPSRNDEATSSFGRITTYTGSNGATTEDNVDFKLKSQLDNVLNDNLNKTLSDIDSILENLELNEANTKIYNYLTDSLKTTTDRTGLQLGEKLNQNTSCGDVTVKQKGGENEMGKIIEAFNAYSRVSTLARCANSSNTLQSISHQLKIDFKLLLHLKQLIDDYYD